MQIRGGSAPEPVAVLERDAGRRNGTGRVEKTPEQAAVYNRSQGWQEMSTPCYERAPGAHHPIQNPRLQTRKRETVVPFGPE